MYGAKYVYIEMHKTMAFIKSNSTYISWNINFATCEGIYYIS